MEGYLGRGQRSRLGWVVSLTSESLVNGPAKEETQEYDVVCFQRCICVFFYWHIVHNCFR